MKTRILLVVLTLLFIAGCSFIQVAPSTNSQAYKLGKMAGSIIKVKYKDMVDIGLPYVKELYASAKDGTITDAQIKKGVEQLEDKLGASDDARLIIGALATDIDITVTTGKVNQNIVDFLQGLIDGAGGTASKST